MFKGFKAFIFRGNVIDLAVGVMIGAAFGSIVASLVNNIFMPVLSIFTGSVNFDALSVTLGSGDAAPVLAYGAFLKSVFDFILIALCIFLIVKAINRVMPKKEAAPARKCPFCQMAIADGATRCPYCTSELEG